MTQQLILNRCPHCRVDSPNLTVVAAFDTKDYSRHTQHWYCYGCAKCGGVVTVTGEPNDYITEMYPSEIIVSEIIPKRAASFLDQAINSLHAPSGAIMLCNSSVDAMLKDKGFKKGTLYHRIEEAIKAHLITKEMGRWAHEVRLDSNDERHADDEADLPSTEDAKKAVDFTLALAEFLFVLPARVERGLKEAEDKQAS